jgi:hypothetical protein
LNFFSGAKPVQSQMNIPTASVPTIAPSQASHLAKASISVEISPVASAAAAPSVVVPSLSGGNLIEAVKQFASTHFGNNYGLFYRSLSEASNSVDGSIDLASNSVSSAAWAASHPTRLKILAGLDEESKQGAVYSKFRRRVAGIEFHF